MIGTVINLRNFDLFGLNVVDTSFFTVNRIDKYTLELDSKATNTHFLFLDIPVRLPPGTEFRFECDAISISGEPPQAGTNTLPSETGAGTAYSDTKLIPAGGYSRLSCTGFTSPARPIARVAVGHFTNMIGKSRIRNPRIIVSGLSESDLLPWLSAVPTYDRNLSGANELLREWTPSISGNGAVTQGADFVTVTADRSSRATVSPAGMIRGISDSVGFMVALRATVRSGVLQCVANLVNTSNEVIQTRRGVFLGESGGWSKFFFQTIQGEDYATLSVGSLTDSPTDADIYDVRLTVYQREVRNSALSVVPISLMLTKLDGAWKIDSGSDRFTQSAVDSISVSSTSITLNFSSRIFSNVRPVIMAQVCTEGDNHKLYQANPGSIAKTSALVQVTSKTAPSNVVDPSALPDGVQIAITGVGCRA